VSISHRTPNAPPVSANPGSLWSLKVFDATARLGSLSAAARELGLRQPTLSAHIAKLEAQYGVELFYRRGRRLALTDFGNTLRESTHRMFRAEADAFAMLAAVRSQYSGQLTICAVGPYNVTPLVRRFRELLPNVRVVVSVGDSQQIIERILDFQCDIGVPVHGVNDPALHCVPYRRQRLVVFASANHPLAKRQSLTLRELHLQEFVVREDGSTTRRVFEQSLRAANVRIRVSVEMGSREAVREAVAQGLGIGVVADAAYIPDARLVRLNVVDFDAHTHAHIVCLAERVQVPLIETFLQVVNETRDAQTAAR
jgi:LysR family transcriptional regulator, low CO2-responsive transcriptional regulator